MITPDQLRRQRHKVVDDTLKNIESQIIAANASGNTYTTFHLPSKIVMADVDDVVAELKSTGFLVEHIQCPEIFQGTDSWNYLSIRWK